MFEPYPKYRNAIPGKRLQILFHPRRVGARRQTTPLFAGKGGPHLRGVLHRAQTLMFLVPRSIATTKELIQDARDEIASRAAFSIPSGVRPNSSKRNFAEPVGLPLDPMFSAAKARRIDLIWAAELLGVDTRELARLAATAPDSRGVYVVPAFGGLGASWWDASAVGTVSGFTFGVTRAPFARAALDSIAHQIADVLDAAQASGATGTATSS